MASRNTPVFISTAFTTLSVLKVQKWQKKNQCRYGSPRIAIELKQAGINVSRPRVARIMKRANLKSIVRKKYRIQT